MMTAYWSGRVLGEVVCLEGGSSKCVWRTDAGMSAFQANQRVSQFPGNAYRDHIDILDDLDLDIPRESPSTCLLDPSSPCRSGIWPRNVLALHPYRAISTLFASPALIFRVPPNVSTDDTSAPRPPAHSCPTHALCSGKTLSP